MSRSVGSRPLPRVVSAKVDFLRNSVPPYKNLAEWKAFPGHVYISAKLPYVQATEDSIWRTPYHDLEKRDKEAGLQKYEEYVRSNPNLLRQIPHLSETATELACWCRPKKCHGDVLVKLIDEYRKGILVIPEPVVSQLHSSQSYYDQGESASAGSYRHFSEKTRSSRINYNDLISSLPDPETVSEDPTTEMTKKIQRLNITRRITDKQPTPLPNSLVDSVRQTILLDPNDNFSSVDSERVQLLNSLFYGFSRASNETLADIIAYVQESFAELYEDE